MIVIWDQLELHSEILSQNPSNQPPNHSLNNQRIKDMEIKDQNTPEGRESPLPHHSVYCYSTEKGIAMC